MRATLLGIFILINTQIYSQCCAGGNGSPIAGGGSQGVLLENQFDINFNYQTINTDKFLTGSKAAVNTESYFKSYKSQYFYNRLGYGVTSKLSMYIESGYFADKSEVGFAEERTYSSKGVGDLILFPRYNVLNKCLDNGSIELTLGLGVKIPFGKYNDSFKAVEPFSGEVYYRPKPLAIQPTSGAHDVILYSFFLRDFKKFRLFANAIYIKKGWNPLGEKIGDFASLAFFAGKTVFKNFGVNVQVRGEWIDRMEVNKSILLYAYPNYDPSYTGSKKVFFTPQVSYTYKKMLTLYALSDFPIYQNVTKTQIASKFQSTFGVSYRFKAHREAE